MKQATTKWLRKQLRRSPLPACRMAAMIALATDAEVKRLRRALRDIMKRGSGPGFTEYEIAEAALKPRKTKRN